jgi:hypothetical protein
VEIENGEGEEEQRTERDSLAGRDPDTRVMHSVSFAHSMRGLHYPSGKRGRGRLKVLCLVLVISDNT